MGKKNKQNGTLTKRSSSAITTKKGNLVPSLKSNVAAKKAGIKKENSTEKAGQKQKIKSNGDGKSQNQQGDREGLTRDNKSWLSDFERGYIEGQKSRQNLNRSYEYPGNQADYDPRYGRVENEYKSGKYENRNNQINYPRNPDNQYGEQQERIKYREFQDRNRRTENYQSDYNTPKQNIPYQSDPGDKDSYKRKRDYQHEGHQYFGETEGFGDRSGQQHGQDWFEQDEYREGHAPTKRGHGKYGSR